MPLRAIARMIQTMLYAQRFFPYYVYNILGGIEEDGEHLLFAVYSLDGFTSEPSRVSSLCHLRARGLRMYDAPYVIAYGGACGRSMGVDTRCTSLTWFIWLNVWRLAVLWVYQVVNMRLSGHTPGRSPSISTQVTRCYLHDLKEECHFSAPRDVQLSYCFNDMRSTWHEHKQYHVLNVTSCCRHWGCVLIRSSWFVRTRSLSRCRCRPISCPTFP